MSRKEVNYVLSQLRMLNSATNCNFESCSRFFSSPCTVFLCTFFNNRDHLSLGKESSSYRAGTLKIRWTYRSRKYWSCFQQPLEWLCQKPIYVGAFKCKYDVRPQKVPCPAFKINNSISSLNNLNSVPSELLS